MAEGKVSTPKSLAGLPFCEAAAKWLDSRKPYLSQRTVKDYEAYIKTLSAFFAESRLRDITAEHLRAYQKMRSVNVCAAKVNQECSTIQQMLKRIGKWQEVGADYQPLPMPKNYESPGRAITDKEKDKLFRVASARREWEVVYLFALISVNTTAGPKEVLTLRHKDVDLDERTITINPEGAKNRAGRVRTIALNNVAWGAIKRATELARERGSTDPDHYLFPFRGKGNAYTGKYDPERHCTTMQKAWERVTKAAGLGRLRLYDLRHTAITNLLQSPDCSEETAEAIAGHISHGIKKRYSHIRMDAKRQALAGLSSGAGAEPASRPAKTWPMKRKTGAVLTNQNILDLLAAGLAPTVAIAAIESSPNAFATDPRTLIELKTAGVPDEVLRAMVLA